MRLTCPRCGAQYEIAPAAIPAAGREVECSACGHVWHQAGAPEQAAPHDPAPYDPAARPALNRPLNESILSILREETARELHAREGAAAEPARDTQRDVAAADAGTAAAEPAGSDWPATTLTGKADDPAPVDAPGAPARPAPAAREAQAGAEAPAIAAAPPPETPQPTEPELVANAGPDPDKMEVPPDEAAQEPPPSPEPVAPSLPDAAELAATLTRSGPAPAGKTTPPQEPEASPLDDTKAAHVVPAAAARRGAGYATGFGLAAMLALGVVTVYALAPRVSTGEDGGLLAEWRQEIDRGRLWLHDRIIGPPPTAE